MKKIAFAIMMLVAALAVGDEARVGQVTGLGGSAAGIGDTDWDFGDGKISVTMNDRYFTVIATGSESLGGFQVGSANVGAAYQGFVELFSLGGTTKLNTLAHTVSYGNPRTGVALTEATDVVIIELATSTGQHGGGTFHYTAFAEDATDHQMVTGAARFNYSNKGGTLLCSTTDDATQDTLVSGGTLTCTSDCNVSTTTAQFRVNCSSSLTTTTFRAEGGLFLSMLGPSGSEPIPNAP